MMSSVAGRVVRTLIGILLIATLANCGLKGDLYLPEPEKAAADQTPNTDDTDTQAIKTTPSGIATAADEDKKTAVEKPSEGAPPQP